MTTSEMAALHHMTVEELQQLYLTFTPPGNVLHKYGDPYELINFQDHVRDIISDEVISQGTPLVRRTLGYMDEALYNLYRMTAATSPIATINHELGYIPTASLYQGNLPYGTGGYGESAYGGSDLEALPVRLIVQGWNTVRVLTSAAYARDQDLEVIRLTSSLYSLAYPDGTTFLSLILR